ncbi:hypothetical protein ACH5Y9_23850 [Methylomonas sp. BW4-1]|uniref:hypothetical protein n=1 Tax=Methylomonas sp. BW4-1 TaxID=3376685 RepID=UPI0040412BF3
MKDDFCLWFEQTKQRSVALSEAYRIRLAWLWYANLCFVVLPAVSSTIAAVLAAKEEQYQISVFCYSMPLVSLLAGLAAVLTAIHKALKCEEYQAECLRLSQAYQSIAVAADAAIFGPATEYAAQHEHLASELRRLAADAKAQVSTNFYSPDNPKR